MFVPKRFRSPMTQEQSDYTNLAYEYQLLVSRVDKLETENRMCKDRIVELEAYSCSAKEKSFKLVIDHMEKINKSCRSLLDLFGIQYKDDGNSNSNRLIAGRS